MGTARRPVNWNVLVTERLIEFAFDRNLISEFYFVLAISKLQSQIRLGQFQNSLQFRFQFTDQLFPLRRLVVALIKTISDGLPLSQVEWQLFNRTGRFVQDANDPIKADRL